MGDVGAEFQEQTKYWPDRLGGGRRWTVRPEQCKAYRESVKIALPSTGPERPATLDEVLRKRKSVREFEPEPITQEQLGYLLWAATGLQRTERGHEFRTAPSAGALYPIETYVVANDVRDLEPGVYHYAIRHHQLERLQTGPAGAQLAAAALGQEMCAFAPAACLWTAVFARSTWKYAARAYRYIYLDTGHIAENFALAAVGLGLGTCQIGALYDDEVNKLLGVDGVEESIVYLSVVGLPAQGG